MQATCDAVASAEQIIVRNVHAPLTVRVLVRCELRTWGLGHLVDACELIASELVTNAIHHGIGEMIGVRLELFPACVVVKVWDGNGVDMPQMREPSSGAEDEHGRGLTITDALSDDWGSYVVEDGGKVVWAKLTDAMTDE